MASAAPRHRRDPDVRFLAGFSEPPGGGGPEMKNCWVKVYAASGGGGPVKMGTARLAACRAAREGPQGQSFGGETCCTASWTLNTSKHGFSPQTYGVDSSFLMGSSRVELRYVFRFFCW